MTTDLEDLRSELAEFAQPKKTEKRSPREERIIAGFEEIQRFVEDHGRAPQHGEQGDIFERLYAVRLDRIRGLAECQDLLRPLDHQSLLDSESTTADGIDDDIDDHELMKALEDGPRSDEDVSQIRHVRTRAEIKAADEIANRGKCEDFDQFKPLLEQAESELKSGIRKARRFGRDASINQGEFFILAGQTVYVAEMGEAYRTPNGESNARMRVVYSNATESNLLVRSLQRALYKDETGRRLTDPDAGPMFAESWEDGDV